MSLTSLIGALPAGAVYAIVGLLVAVESLGIPVPGETALITGALLSTHPASSISISIWGVFLAALVGAVVGDSVGYTLGRRMGPGLIDRLSRRFPRHLSEQHVGYARHLFGRYGVAAVFGGRFVALLRILSGPLAGSLAMPYPRFLLANVAGAVGWAGAITLAVHLLGAAAHHWISGAGWVMLVVAVVVGLVASRRAGRVFDNRAQAFWAANERAESDLAWPASPC